MSDYVTCKNTKTRESSKENKIIEEINRIEATATKLVDSDFFQPGVLQREDRTTYLLKLHELLATITTRGKGACSKHSETQHIIDPSQEGSDIHDINRAVTFRKNKFEFRIDCLKHEIKQSKKTLLDISRERVILTRNMQEAQDRIFLLHAEQNCVAKSTDEYLSSNVINGSKQKLKREDLRKEIEREMSDKMLSISSWKLKIIMGDKKRTKLERLLKTKQEYLRERLEGLKSFERRTNVSSRIKSNISRQRKDIVIYYFTTWKKHLRNVKKKTHALDRISIIRCHLILRPAVQRWRKKNKSSSSNCNESKNYNKASLMLSQVCAEQQRAYEEVKGSIIDLYECSGASLFGKRNIYMKSIPQRELLNMRRGDHYCDLGKFQYAVTIYLEVLEGAKKCISKTVHTHKFYCLVEEKIARAYMKEKLWDNAILYLDSLSSRVKSFQFSEFITTTEILLGECYLESGEIELAKEKYLNGLEKLQYLTNKCPQLSNIYQGLYRCYEKMDDWSRSKEYKDLYNSSRVTLNDKIDATLYKASELNTDILNTSVREGSVIHFQNASLNYVETKTKIKELEDYAKEKNRESRENKEEIKRLHCLIQRISDEVSHVLGNDATIQTSSLVHDNKQKIKTTELVERLELRKKCSKESLQNEMERERNIRVEIRNIEDEKSILVQDLGLEEGRLIQKMLKKRIIRCMAFNMMNKSGVDVFGTKNAGTKLVVVTVDTEIYVYDMIKGSLVHVFLGGCSNNIDVNRNGHTSIITCIFYHGNKVFSGAMDKTVRCWNINEERLEFVARGHDATVTSIFSDGFSVISGSADKSLIIWNSLTGQMIYRAMGHSRGISSLDLTSSWCISGDSDGEIFVWEMNEEVTLIKGI